MEGVNESSWTRTFQDSISAETMAKMLKDAHLEYTDNTGGQQRVEIDAIEADDIVINAQNLDFENEEGTVNATFSFKDEDGKKYEVLDTDIAIDCGDIHDGREYWKLYLSGIKVISEDLKIQ